MAWVKICGTTNLEDARTAVEAGADAVGFVFAPSPRRVQPDTVREIVSQLPPQVDKVGVFVNETAERIREIVQHAGLTVVQLHGDEDVNFVKQLSPDQGPARLRVIKAVPVRGGFGASVLAFTERGGAEAVLLDSASALRGGSGEPFNWRLVAQYMPSHAGDLRVIVAGGLDPANVARPLRMIRPWGVDVVSGVEREPGKKDPEKVKAFVAAVRLYEKSV